MDKVEETYGAENKLEKVTEFLQTLQTFNQSTDKVEDLYYVSFVILFKNTHCQPFNTIENGTIIFT